MSNHSQPSAKHHDAMSRFVRLFLDSNLSAILIVFSVLAGLAALWATPREEDPQIVVPLADVFVNFPGHSAAEVEQLVSGPLERILYQIDGVEYVYSMSRENQAIITVRFYVGEDRERSLVKITKKLDEHADVVPPGVAGWVVKPVEIDDVPVVTLALSGSDSHTLRRLAEESIERLAAIPDVSRAYVIGGEPRVVRIELDPDRLEGMSVSPLEIERALRGANLILPAGGFSQADEAVSVEAGLSLLRSEDLGDLIVSVASGRPVFLRDVARVVDGPAEIENYVRHGWGPARGFIHHIGSPGTLVGTQHPAEETEATASDAAASIPAVTLALAKKKGTNAVAVADSILNAADELRRDVLPDDVEMIVTRNNGLTADEKVNELIEALAVAILIVIALLTWTLGWREAVIVAVAIPVVFGLTLTVNYLFGYSINRVTLFALILSLGLLVDDPIVDVENITRHYQQRRRATRDITLDAVAEIRPPLISATLAVMVSFLPLFFITGMMGPYMAPMALNVPVAMLMSMLVAFTITPWLSYHMLQRHFNAPHGSHEKHEPNSTKETVASQHELYDPAVVQKTLLYRIFRPIMAPLLATKMRAVAFLLLIAALTVAALGLAASRSVPLKMLPFDNKNEMLFVFDFDEDQTLERVSATIGAFEERLAAVPEVIDYSSYVGTPGPIDFNGLVRHYYLRQSPNQAEIRVNFVGKKNRNLKSHAIGLRLRDELTALADTHNARLKIVELPPGPPVLASVVAEVYGRPDNSYDELLAAAERVAERFRAEPGMADIDSIRDVQREKLRFLVDQEKAALTGVSVAEIAGTVRLGLDGASDQTLRVASERNPLRINIRLPEAIRSDEFSLARLPVKGITGNIVPVAELGSWSQSHVDQTIYHKNLERVAYVFAETVGRPPAECIADLLADRAASGSTVTSQSPTPRPVAERTYFTNGGGVPWTVPEGIRVDFAGEGEWKITLDVFRDLGIAFGTAMLMIYVILVAQTGSFAVPVIVMLAIPLTVLGVMPGFWLLNAVTGQTVGGYADPVFFTATAMIGMIALAGIVTRDAIILVDFIHLSIAQGRTLFEAILESRVVRLRPILLTAGAAALSSIPITIDPIFSGLGWSLIFGLVASTVFTLFVIPLSYWIVYATPSDQPAEAKRA